MDLVLPKPLADRLQDSADVFALVDAGLEVADVVTYLRRHAPDLVHRFAETVGGRTLTPCARGPRGWCSASCCDAA